MKPRHASVALLLAAVLGAGSLAGVTACNPRQKRNDWRSPPPRTACASDSDCPNGTCAIQLGATQGVCNAVALPPLPGAEADGGARPGSPPLPNIQPSSSD